MTTLRLCVRNMVGNFDKQPLLEPYNAQVMNQHFAPINLILFVAVAAAAAVALLPSFSCFCIYAAEDDKRRQLVRNQDTASPAEGINQRRSNAM